jgi:hypothetical protein
MVKNNAPVSILKSFNLVTPRRLIGTEPVCEQYRAVARACDADVVSAYDSIR